MEQVTEGSDSNVRYIDGEDERASGGIVMSLFSSVFDHRASPVVHLDNTGTISDFQGPAIVPQNTANVHLLIQRRTSGGINKFE